MKNYEEIAQFFSECGGTDYEYLKTHFDRFKRTFEFVIEGNILPGVILDLGAHWLHLSSFFCQYRLKDNCSRCPGNVKASFCT